MEHAAATKRDAATVDGTVSKASATTTAEKKHTTTNQQAKPAKRNAASMGGAATTATANTGGAEGGEKKKTRRTANQRRLDAEAAKRQAARAAFAKKRVGTFAALKEWKEAGQPDLEISTEGRFHERLMFVNLDLFRKCCESGSNGSEAVLREVPRRGAMTPFDLRFVTTTEGKVFIYDDALHWAWTNATKGGDQPAHPGAAFTKAHAKSLLSDVFNLLVGDNKPAKAGVPVKCCHAGLEGLAMHHNGLVTRLVNIVVLALAFGPRVYNDTHHVHTLCDKVVNLIPVTDDDDKYNDVYPGDDDNENNDDDDNENDNDNDDEQVATPLRNFSTAALAAAVQAVCTTLCKK